MEENLGTLPCGLLTFDDTSVICEVNPEANRILGYEGRALVGQELRVLLSPGTRMFFQAHLYPLLARDGRVDEVYVGLRTQAGTDIPCLVNAVRRGGKVGNLNEFAFMPMRRRQYFEREYLGARRGEMLAQQAEQTARRQIESMASKIAASERLIVLGTLAAGVAHEVNNPLTYVLWSLESLKAMLPEAVKKRQLERVTQLLDDVEMGAELIRGIVSGLKLFSRVDEERRVNVDVGQVLRAAERMVRFEVSTKAKFAVTCAKPAPVVVGDESKLVQVLVNLVLNAAQAFPLAAPENLIEVRVSSTDENVVVEVRDNGPGISEEIQDRIFEPFFTTKPVGVGTGLGLSICHGIVRSFGGTLSLHSSPGSGATFRIVLEPAQDGSV